jgi:hypothetical protein
MPSLEGRTGWSIKRQCRIFKDYTKMVTVQRTIIVPSIEDAEAAKRIEGMEIIQQISDETVKDWYTDGVMQFRKYLDEH